MSELIIDVGQLDKSIRKDALVQSFKSLPEGDTMILRHNYDPLPLKNVFSTLFTGKFLWEYRKSGPDEWEIAVQKIFREDYIVNELIVEYPQSIHVFEKYKVEYYLNGNELLKECLPTKYKIREVLGEIFEGDYTYQKFTISRFQNWSLDLIVEYILQNHHSYVYQVVPEIEKLAGKVAIQHGKDQPEFQLFIKRFKEFKEDLYDHMKEEETIVFPCFKELAKNQKNIGQIEDDINWMKEDHFLVSDSLRNLRSICNQYSDSRLMLPAYPVLVEEMQKLEQDFHLHLHIENNILFPKVLQFIS